MHDDEQYFFEALKAGASGYVLKTAANRELVEACRAAMRGEPFLYPSAATALIRDYLERARSGEAAPRIRSPRASWRSLKLIAEGHTSEEIADMLVISKKTVERHRANILEKLGMRNRVELTPVCDPARSGRAVRSRPAGMRSATSVPPQESDPASAASDQHRPLAHAVDAGCPATSSPAAPGPAPSSRTVRVTPVRVRAQGQRRVAGARVADHVHQALLRDPVDDELGRGGQLRQRGGGVDAHPHAALGLHAPAPAR